jgi:hypothetical protein
LPKTIIASIPRRRRSASPNELRVAGSPDPYKYKADQYVLPPDEYDVLPPDLYIVLVWYLRTTGKVVVFLGATTASVPRQDRQGGWVSPRGG